MTSFRQKFLKHASNQPYDPAARRERYLKERQLKGRRAGSSPPPTGQPNTPDKGSTPPKGPEDPGQQHQPVQTHPPGTPITPERVAALKVRLDALKDVLAKLVDAAKESAGVETPTKETKKSADSKDKPEKPKTAAEKKDAAKKAKEARDKAPDKPDTAASVKAEIASVQRQIEEARAKLAAARKAASSKKPPPKQDPNWQDKFKEKDDQKHPAKQPTVNDGRQH